MLTVIFVFGIDCCIALTRRSIQENEKGIKISAKYTEARDRMSVSPTKSAFSVLRQATISAVLFLNGVKWGGSGEMETEP